MGLAEDIRASFGDAFVTLPLLIAGVLFFVGTLTSNTGMLYLFLGHMLVVPSLSFLSNEVPPFLRPTGRIPFTSPENLVFILKWVVSTAIWFGITMTGYRQKGEESVSTSIKATSPLLYFFTFLFNPLHIILKSPPVPSGPNCSIYPNAKDSDTIYSNPSNWITHVVFFFSFVIANAVQIYNLPTPTIKGTDDPKINKERQATLEARVSNRKWLTAAILLVSVVSLVGLLILRFNSTPCERSFWHALFPMAATGFLSTAYYGFITNFCGARPTDVLGIVQGMISPELADNPIVCVGS